MMRHKCESNFECFGLFVNAFVLKRKNEKNKEESVIKQSPSFYYSFSLPTFFVPLFSCFNAKNKKKERKKDLEQ
jgi:hypothetical protein